MHTYEHHRTVDKESDGYQASYHYAEVGDVLPIDKYHRYKQRHKDDGRQCTAALEHVVAEPSAEYGTRYGGYFISEICPAGALDVDALLGEDSRSPVEATVAHHIHEGIGKCYVPQEFVAEHYLEYLAG